MTASFLRIVRLPLQKSHEYIPALFSIFLLLIGWHLASTALPNFLLPSPVETFQESYKTFASADFIYSATLTLYRTITSFALAFLIANILAISSFLSDTLRRFWWPLILLGLSVPAIIATFIAIVIFGSRGPVALIVVTALLVPFLYFILYPGYANINKDLLEMAKVFRLSRLSCLKYVILPQVTQHLFAAIRTGITDGWRLTILAEVFSLSDGVGYQILQYFNLFSIRGVFAWLISFLLVINIIEYFILQPLERLVTTHRLV